MEIAYQNRKIESVCKNASVATQKYGLEMAEKIQLRIDQIQASESIEHMLKYRIGRCHPLNGDRKNQYAVDLVHPLRLVFTKKGDKIQIAQIIEIVDYH